MPDSNALDPLTFYESPTFGYVIPWFEDIWQLESSESGNDGDLVTYRRTDDVLTFHGYTGDGGDPDACLTRLTDRLEQNSDAEPELGIDFYGNPMQGGDRYYAWAVYRTTPSGDAGEKTLETVWHLECRRLIPDSAVLAITLEMPRQRYDRLLDPAYDFMDAVVLPRRSFDVGDVDGQTALIGPLLFPALEQWDCYFPRNPGLLFDRAGNEAGMATLVAYYDPNDSGAWHLFVLFENTGNGDVAVDPMAVEVHASSQFGADAFEGDVARPAGYLWETGEGNPGDRTRVIAPGTRALVRLTFAEPFFDGLPPGPTTFVVTYATKQTPSVGMIGWRECQGGGNRPRLG